MKLNELFNNAEQKTIHQWTQIFMQIICGSTNIHKSKKYL